MVKKILCCDHCEEPLERAQDIYHLNFSSNSFWDGVEKDYLEVNLVFCLDCARDIKTSLKEIVERGENNA